MGRRRIPGFGKAGDHPPVEQSHLPVRQTLARLGILPGTFYRCTSGSGAAGPRHWKTDRPGPGRYGTASPNHVCEQVLQLALNEPESSPRELAARFSDTRKYFVPEASVYRLLKAHDLIASPAFIVMKAADELKGQDDGAQPAVADRLHLSEGHRLRLVLPVDHRRRLLALHHCLETVHDDKGLGRERHPEAGAASIGGSTRPLVLHRPWLLSANGSSYLSANLAEWLDERKTQKVRGAPYHPMTQGKIERWHQTLKNRILLQNCYLPGELETQIGDFVAYYNHLRYHESGTRAARRHNAGAAGTARRSELARHFAP
jgi:putative transposase